MPTAPSFQDFKHLSEPYTKNNKSYIKVQNEKTGTIREVRWYSDAEYEKLYNKKTMPKAINLKRARGFEVGPIFVVRNNRNEDEEWLRQSVARYAMGIGWHFISSDTVPKDAPPHLKYIPLTWEEFQGQGRKTPEELANLIKEKVRNNEHISIYN